jgi:hypothetical protein
LLDVRAPSLNGPADTFLGYDRSNRIVSVDTKTVTDGSTPANTASPQIVRDFNFANRIYVQSGVSIIETAEKAVTEAGITFPVTDAEAAQIAGNAANRAAAAAVNNRYIGFFLDGFRGLTYYPGPAGNAGVVGTFIADTAVSDTFAHEIGRGRVETHQRAALRSAACRCDSADLCFGWLKGGGRRSLVPGEASNAYLPQAKRFYGLLLDQRARLPRQPGD